MRSIDHLREEHALIERVLDGLETLARHAERGEPVPVAPVAGAVDFFAAFADRGHHAKEEEVLLPALEAAGGSGQQGLLATMRAEHARGRSLLGALAEKLRPGATPVRVANGVAGSLRAYLAFQREHLAREDVLVFREAERRLSAADDAALLAGYEAIHGRTGGQAAYEALREVGLALERACRTTGVPLPDGRTARVADVMRPNVPPLVPAESLARAAALMETLDLRELPVVEKGTLVGILTQTDLLPHRGHYEWTAVRSAMTPCPVTVEPDMPVPAAADLLLARRFNALPVTDGGRLVGMVGRADLLRLLAPVAG